MKLTRMLLMFVFVLLTINQSTADSEPTEENGINWVTIEEVQELVKQEPKPVFMDFTAEWCGWCKVMDKKTFSDAEIAEFINSNYYAVKVDFESKEKFNYLGELYTGKELAKKYKITGLPTILFASPDFNKIKPVVGYQNVDQFMTKLKKYQNL
jgi:thioredoxin-related protein